MLTRSQSSTNRNVKLREELTKELAVRTVRPIWDKLLIVVCFTRLRCTYTPCLSAWLRLCFSYRMKILLIVVFIVFKSQIFIIRKEVQALSLADRYPFEQCETSGVYWQTLSRRGRLFPEDPSHEPLNPPCPQETKSSHSINIIVITALQQNK